jgi:RHS repeat-associated protein
LMNASIDSQYQFVSKILREARSGAPERYLTTHHERDELSNLDYRFARYYDSDIGRFLSVDPLAADYVSWSPYNYVMGNPISFVDPDGKAIRPTSNDAWVILNQMLGSFGVSTKDMYNILKIQPKVGYKDVIQSNLISSSGEWTMGIEEFNTHIRKDISRDLKKQMDMSEQSLQLLYGVYKMLNELGIYDFGIIEHSGNTDDSYNINDEGRTTEILDPDEKNKSTNANLNEFLEEFRKNPSKAIQSKFGNRQIIILPYSPNKRAQSENQSQRAEEYGSIIYNISGVNPYNRSEILKQVWYELNSH